jgi:homoserine kinase type II
MAVFTEVSLDELEAVLARYDVGRPVSFKGIAEGVENSNFQLLTDRGAFILTLYEKRVRGDDLPYFLTLMDNLAARGVPCPVPVRDRAGQTSFQLNRRPAALLTFLQGLSVRRPQIAHCAEAGAAIAGVHQNCADFPLVRPNGLGPEGWKNLADAIGEQADSVEQGLAAMIAQILARFERDWPRDLPAGVIHADLFPDNVLFLDNRISGLIDFYFACNDFFAYDVAVMLNAWCFEDDGAFNHTKGHALLAAYRRVRELSSAECDALPILAQGAALRFLLTRLYDWLNPDPQALLRPKDPREFVRRLRFHLNVRSAADYGL